MQRETENRISILAGGEPARVGELKLRPISMATMSILELTGNAVLGALNPNGEDSERAIGLYDLSEFVWVHAAPEDEVIELVASDGFLSAETRKKAVLKFAAGVEFDKLKDVMAAMTRELEHIKKAQVSVVSDGEGGTSKN